MRSPIALLALLLLACPAPADDDDSSSLAASEEDFQVDAGDLMLEGTLLLPERSEETLVPGVVLVHGSGPHSRDSPLSGQLNLPFGFEISLFAELGVALQDAGYAVYRYDKRTCGSWGSCDNDYPLPDAGLTIEALVEDAAAAVDALADHEAVDADAVAVVGHSQGGGMVPRLVFEGAPAGVSLAGPWNPIDDLLVFQEESSRAVLADLGWEQAQIDATLAGLAEGNAALAQLRAGTWDGSPILGSSPAFWQSWMDLGDARPGLIGERADVLAALNGTEDWNVPPSELDGWADAGVTISRMPCATHALNCLAESDLAEITPDDLGREVDPGVITDLVAALSRVLP